MRLVLITAGRPVRASASSSWSGVSMSPKAAQGMPTRPKSCFSQSRSCEIVRLFGPGRMCVLSRSARERGRRHVLELEGDAARAVGEPVERLGIVVRRRRSSSQTSPAQASSDGIEAADDDAERRGREREHAAELAAADAADDRRAGDQALRGSGSASTASVCSRRKRSSTARSSGRERARIGRRRAARR